MLRKRSIGVIAEWPSGPAAALLVALISGGCGGQDSTSEAVIHDAPDVQAMSESADSPYQVPPIPPDTVPASFDEDAVFVADGTDGSMSRVSTTILAVHFALGASLAQKQEAVDMIAGRVIGGAAISEEGLYYVQIEGDSTIATIDSIAAVLRALPMIASAYPERLFPIGR